MTVVAARRMLHADGTLADGWVQVDGALIVAAGTGDPPQPAGLHVEVLAPGFVDVHCHGGGGASFCTTDRDEARRAVLAHREAGTTSVVAGVVTDTVPTMAAQVGVLAGLVEEGELAGIHLEGPWLNPRFAGAHQSSLLVPPQRDDVAAVVAAGRGMVRMVTLAPELPGGMDAVRQVVGAGAVAAIGHTDADGSVALAAVDAGARVTTHLFNAMRPIHHRDPGPAPVLLDDERVTVELVADGRHVHPAVLAMAARSTTGGFALVSDAFAGALAPDGTYRLGGADVEVRDGVARLAGTDTLASSTLTIRRAVQVIVAAGIPLADALLAGSTVPAVALGLEGIGAIAPGMRADLVSLTDTLDLHSVMHAGRWVSRSQPA